MQAARADPWQRTITQGYATIAFGVFIAVGLTIAYLLLLPGIDDPLAWTLMIVPLDIAFTCWLLASGVLIIRRYGKSVWRAFPFKSSDAVKLLEIILNRMGVVYETDVAKFNWLLLTKPEAVLWVRDWKLEIEVFGGEWPQCSVYIGRLSPENESRVRNFLRTLDDAAKPAILN